MTTQYVYFGLDLLGEHDRVFNPRFGPLEVQSLRRQPFGVSGELELLGRPGGQTVIVPIRIFAKTRKALRDRIELIRGSIGLRKKLRIQYGAVATNVDSIGMVTLDAIDEDPARDIVFSTDDANYRVQCDVTLVFRKLNQAD